MRSSMTKPTRPRPTAHIMSRARIRGPLGRHFTGCFQNETHEVQKANALLLELMFRIQKSSLDHTSESASRCRPSAQA
jgi:hypothetical protein